MGRLFNYDSPIMQALQKIATVIFCGFFWLLLCLPLVTAGASTIAMYTELFHLREDKEASVKQFFAVFAREFPKGSILWGIDLIAVALLILLLSLLTGTEINGVLQLSGLVFCFFILVLYMMTFSYVFPLEAYFDNTIKETLKNAFYMSVSHLKQTVPVLALAILPFSFAILTAGISYELFYYLFLSILPVWIFVILPLCLYGQTYFLLKVFKEYS